MNDPTTLDPGTGWDLDARPSPHLPPLRALQRIWIALPWAWLFAPESWKWTILGLLAIVGGVHLLVLGLHMRALARRRAPGSDEARQLRFELAVPTAVGSVLVVLMCALLAALPTGPWLLNSAERTLLATAAGLALVPLMLGARLVLRHRL